MQCLVSCDEHLSHSHLILYITGLKYFHYRHTNIFHKRHSNTILNMDPRAYFDVINDVVGNFMDPFVPTVTVTAYFGDHRLTNCSELRLATAQIAPRVVIGGNQDELYTLIMVDPDAPNPNEPSSREVVLWIVTNIPGGTSTAEGSSVVKVGLLGRVLGEYSVLGPPPRRLPPRRSQLVGLGITREYSVPSRPSRRLVGRSRPSRSRRSTWFVDF
ncbi:putative phosphatidylethanolamine-binding protein [Helianthus annuus]|uniref:Phosphatidylethanolamine-binding protein n=1 Tax=Helianthus annuus TaxID=4232 RepID=A0A9K3DQT1_HELAN|nr:putative phosphatidylethanolamine-binding protein [Helianthus annuus]KAJ0438022.1 putative phosphatidylethanolamine-binding protein [Helianthus annuus]KAJ0460348.1 putative phosphatidylethanolamine-binding protein [Helianthus annuus]KAJ0644700.1 putative phosphatidylethanolamine-binding protein [Helianthus annuus]KAJ0835720.1 putative phosphatidylethanolamine-binding protein [Helianthus annuus]